MLGRVLQGFAGPALESIARAQREAVAMGDREVGVEHLLLGLFSDREDSVSAVLAPAGLSIQPVRALVGERVDAASPGLSPGGGPAFSPEAKDALTFAYRFGMGEAGSEHILMSLVARGDNGACEILRRLGVDPGRLRFELKKLLMTAAGHDGLRRTATAHPILPELDFGS
jgi:ATP-dependent Clp protease ATP-binding subunit ClpC